MKLEDIPMLPPHMLAGWVRNNLPAHYGEIRRDALAESKKLTDTLLDGYERLLYARDSDMADGDLAREVAEQMLALGGRSLP